ncbi:protein odd-skipped-like [Penaeus indicus]|uniref:protein odd-skipped-like n=1 Tax=Penaeus indicus TaxID=29960 RepID=UPI00300C629E
MPSLDLMHCCDECCGDEDAHLECDAACPSKSRPSIQLPRSFASLNALAQTLPPPGPSPASGNAVPRASVTVGVMVGAMAVVEGGRVCRRTKREGGRSYVCRVCERRFPRAYLLLVHERTHTPLTCPVCGRTFRRSEHLRMHRETHGGSKRTT